MLKTSMPSSTFSAFALNWRYASASPLQPIVTISLYLPLAFLLRKAVLKRTDGRGLNLGLVLPLHNFLLLLASLIMFVGLFSAVVADASQNGIHSTLCRETAGTLGGIWIWCYLFYLSKYYELLDTFLLALRAKPLTGLHLFHHAVVVPLFWLMLELDATNLWVAALLNTAVHIPMYYYFAVESLPADSFWRGVLPSLRAAKKWITSVQITQFYIDIATIAAVDAFLPECRQRLVTLFHQDTWALTKVICIFAVPAVLIILFTRFYRQSYRTSRVSEALKKHDN